MENGNISRIDYDKLKLDRKNPRLSEFGITSKSPLEKVLQILWDEMAVNELMYSIVSNGFWDYEPLIIMKDPKKNGNYIVIEGNRRLAAVYLLHNPSQIEATIPQHITDKATPGFLKDIQKLPVIIVKSRKEAWKYIGFKHVNGPAKWGSFAKAKYIAEIHNDFAIPIETIAYQIGDTHNTAQKLYQGLMVLEQANNSGTFHYGDVQANRIYFSHLYTGLQREGIKEYLNLKDAQKEDKTPVPKKSLPQLKEVLQWLFGDKREDLQPIIRSQNPDLKHLDQVLQSKEATAALRDNASLADAYELSRANDALFEESLLAAKRNLQKARAYLTTGYKGEESLLKVALSIADLADDLFEEMDRKSRPRTRDRKHRTEGEL